MMSKENKEFILSFVKKCLDGNVVVKVDDDCMEITIKQNKYSAPSETWDYDDMIYALNDMEKWA